MFSRTRRPTLPLLAILLVAACSAQTATTPGASVPLATNPTNSYYEIVGSDGSARPGASARPGISESATQAEIERLSARVEADPNDPATQRDLGLALLQRVRETADPSLYAPAEAALRRALELAPDDVLVLVGLGGLQLGRHEFAEALETGESAVEAFPDYGPAHGVVVDALVELGRYDEATTEVERMVKLSADLPALARLSYVRELHGDLPGALEAMQQAAASPGLAPENTAFVTALLGNLLVANGDPDAAKAAYETALRLVPNHAPSIAGPGSAGDRAGRPRQRRRPSSNAPPPSCPCPST